MQLLKKVIISIICIVILISNIPIYGMNLYNRRSTNTSDTAKSIMQLVATLLNKINIIDEEQKSGISLLPSEDNSETINGEKVNVFSEEFLNTVSVELEDYEQFDNLSVINIIKIVCNIMKAYKDTNTEVQTISDSKQLALLASATSSTKDAGPITITPAKLNEEEITLITLGKEEIISGEATGIREDVLENLDKSNDYLVDVMNLFETTDENGELIIPEDKPIVVVGSSLGGMVAQQLLTQDNLTNKYDFEAIICFGSPLIAPEARNDTTKIVRFCDENDIVPHLGNEFISNDIQEDIIEELDNKEKIVENGEYNTFIEAHIISYVENKCWNDYDVLGVKNGENAITLEENMTFYEAPTLQQ